MYDLTSLSPPPRTAVKGYRGGQSYQKNGRARRNGPCKRDFSEEMGE